MVKENVFYKRINLTDEEKGILAKASDIIYELILECVFNEETLASIIISTKNAAGECEIKSNYEKLQEVECLISNLSNSNKIEIK